jgi:O-antigen/teichoic acid export membrane protein
MEHTEEASPVMRTESDSDGAMSGPKPEASLRKRYFSKLTTNLLGMVIGIITQSIVPRALGPAVYGNFSFLTNFFQQVVGFLNFNTSTAFYTKLSQRQDDRKLVSFYFYVILLLGLILGLFVAACFMVGKSNTIWPGQSGIYVVFGALWAFLTFFVMILNDMSDAYGLTVKSEMAKLAIKFFGLIVVLILFWQKLFSLTNYFAYHFLLLTITLILFYRIIHGTGHAIFGEQHLRKDEIKAYGNEFSGYCLPLVVFSGFAVLEGILDRWFLQKFAGSEQQGFYGLAYQIGAICFLFCSAMIPLLAREYAISFEKRDLDEMRRLFTKFVPILYAIAAYFSCFLAVESKNVMLLIGGKAYAGAVVPITIMCFYPIHQTYGQINATVFFATSRTVAYRNIGIALIFIGLPLTFILLGPREYGALQTGATGLAAKMVMIQFLSVNIQLWYNAKMMKLPFRSFFIHQILVISAFVALALISSYAARSVLQGTHFFVQFLGSGFLYTLCILGLVLFYPAICGMKKAEVVSVLGHFFRKKDGE